MATNDICKLIVNLKVYYFYYSIAESVDHILRQGTLNDIDALTASYSDKGAFYKHFEKGIYDCINREEKRKTGFGINSVELGTKGVYILKNDKPILPIFKTISVKGEVVPFSNFLLKKMYAGSMVSFYKCDKKRMADISYDSFFYTAPESMVERLELGVPTTEDLYYFYNKIKRSKRYYQIVRFLLIDPQSITEDELYERFLQDIPNSEGRIILGEERQETKEYSYRYPYKD